MMIRFAYKLVEVVSEEVSTHTSTMPIVNSKERALRPSTRVGFQLGLHDVEDDGHSVFVVVSKQFLSCSDYLEMP